jgi:hypothetical protein
MAGCGVQARHARPTDTGIPVPRGSGVQGEDDDPQCRQAQFVAVCGRASALDDVVSSPARDNQVEKRRIVVDGNVVRLVAHYRSGDKAPETLIGDEERALELNHWTHTRNGHQVAARGSGDYTGWTLTLVFSWSSAADPMAETDVDVIVTASGPVAA